VLFLLPGKNKSIIMKTINDHQNIDNHIITKSEIEEVLFRIAVRNMKRKLKQKENNNLNKGKVFEHIII